MHSPDGTVLDNHFLLRADSRYHPAYTSIRVTYYVLHRYVTHTVVVFYEPVINKKPSAIRHQATAQQCFPHIISYVMSSSGGTVPI
jgi:hypothetical protein